jgi:Ca2+-binding RTX toxin-like protein
MIGSAVELRTNVGDNVIHGTDNDNILRGGAGNDELYGYFGNDKLYGDAGNDLLFGGAGTDQAIYKGVSANYQITYNTDGSVNIVDTLGTEGNDHLTGIEQAVFSDRVIDLSSTTTPPPPTDPGDPPPNSEGGHAPSITLPAPTVLGTSAGRELLIGTSGNDVIDGGGGKYDTMQGGLGDDIYIVKNSAAIIKEAAGQGNDTLYSSAAFYSSGADIETLYMLGEAKELRGGSGDNAMHGTDGDNIIRGGSGNDQLFGYYGDDTLYGEFGDDLLYGGEGNDTAAYKRDYANYSVVQNGDGSVTVTDNVNADGTDTLTSIELLSFSDQTIDLSVLFG